MTIQNYDQEIEKRYHPENFEEEESDQSDDCDETMEDFDLNGDRIPIRLK